MILTEEQFAILAYVVVDPQAWADHAEATIGTAAVIAKIEKYRAGYDAEKSLPCYKTRAERELLT